MPQPAPFLVLSLPRSRSAWLSKFLTYGEWGCGHDELRHMRSLDDVRAWFSQPCTGSAETAGAPWWRLLDRFAPDCRILVVRRPVGEVVDSLMRLPGIVFDRAALTAQMNRVDRKLDQIEKRARNVLSVRFSALEDEQIAACAFEHCLPYAHDHDHWAALAPVNVQCDMRAMVRYVTANRAALAKLVAVAKHTSIAAMSARPVADLDGITFQTEPFDQWLADARALFDDHLTLVGEAPGDWQTKNIPLMRQFDAMGAMQIMTARSNGRMFGYLMTLIAPSLASETLISATNGTFYADPSVPGLGMRLQRAAIARLRARGVDHIFMQAGTRGSGERIGALYQRLGAVNDGQMFRLQLTGA